MSKTDIKKFWKRKNLRTPPPKFGKIPFSCILFNSTIEHWNCNLIFLNEISINIRVSLIMYTMWKEEEKPVDIGNIKYWVCFLYLFHLAVIVSPFLRIIFTTKNRKFQGEAANFFFLVACHCHILLGIFLHIDFAKHTRTKSRE